MGDEQSKPIVAKDRYQIDYAMGYDFNGMKEIIKGLAKEMGVSVKKYLKDGKKKHSEI
jgi:hypothetical protein